VNALPVDMVLRGHSKGVRGLAISPDGRRAYSASVDRTVKTWDLETGACLATLDTPPNGPTLAISPHGDTLACSENKFIRLINPATGAYFHEFRSTVTYNYSMKISPDGKWLASLGHLGEVEILDLPNTKPHKAWKVTSPGVPGSIVFGADSKWLAVTESYAVSLWDPVTGALLRKIADPTAPTTSPNDWTRSVVAPVAMAISPDGKTLVTGTWRGHLQWWDFASGTLLATAQGAHGGAILSCDFSPDGSRLISAGMDRVVKLWDVASRREVLAFEGHTGQVGPVAFTPDGRRIVSASEDSTLRVWDAGPKAITNAAATTRVDSGAK